MSNAIGLIGAAIVGLAAVYYMLDVIRGNSRPQRTSWAVWTVIGVLGFGSADSAGAGPGAYAAAVYAIAYICTFLLSLNRRYGKPGGMRYDLPLGILAVAAVLVWRFGGLTNDLATGFAVSADALALWPTLRDAWRQPGSESRAAWIADGVGTGLCVIALPRYDFAASAYPIYLFLGTSAVAVTIVVRLQIDSTTQDAATRASRSLAAMTGTARTEVSYDLDADAIESVLRQEHARLPRTRSQYACILVQDADPLSNVARSVERKVFEEAFGNDADQMRSEYSMYEASSAFLLVVDMHRLRPAGSMRLIYSISGPCDYKSIDDLKPAFGINSTQYFEATKISDRRKVIDVATLAVCDSHRGSTSGSYIVSTLLYRALTLFILSNGFEHLVAILDRDAWRALTYLGMPITDALEFGHFPYLGSQESRAAYLLCSEFFPALLRRNAELRRQLWSVRALILSPQRYLRKVASLRLQGAMATGKGLDHLIVL